MHARLLEDWRTGMPLHRVQDPTVHVCGPRTDLVILRHPRMLKSLFGRHTLCRVHYKQLLDKVACWLAQRLPNLGFFHVELALPDLLMDLVARKIRAEGQLIHQEPEHYAAQAPEVTLRGVAPVQHLRCLVAKGPARPAHWGAIRVFAETEVNELQRTLAVLWTLIDKVGGLKIAVDYATLVEVVDRLQHLLGRLRSGMLGKAALPQAIQQRTAPQVLDDNLNSSR
mmetsp:Transcript_48614/g.125342  ORF Transcript_48614/g.125342 Transcript_48614/m.125342 type:complete len:226 (+) Transcript_48614:1167-1844(+)